MSRHLMFPLQGVPLLFSFTLSSPFCQSAKPSMGGLPILLGKFCFSSRLDATTKSCSKRHSHLFCHHGKPAPSFLFKTRLENRHTRRIQSCFMQTLHWEEHGCSQLELENKNYPAVKLQWLDETASCSLPTFPVIQWLLPEH